MRLIFYIISNSDFEKTVLGPFKDSAEKDYNAIFKAKFMVLD